MKRLFKVNSVIFTFFLASIFFVLTDASAENKNAVPATEEQIFIRNLASDTNKDGKPDRWEYYEGGVLIRIEADGNYDGKIDEWAHLKEGKVIKVEKDSDYDGKVDKWATY